MHVLEHACEWARLLAVAWLLLVGLWSAPALGATLVYPNGMLAVEAVLAVVLIILGWRGRVRPLRSYPFLWPCLAVLAVCAVAAALRVLVRGTAADAEALRLWQTGEPMARALLLYLAIAGHPRIPRIAWMAVLAGMTLQAGAAVIQHATGVSRWYADLDTGWTTGWQPTAEAVQHVHGQMIAQRVQGLTSYINLTAAMLAASLPCWMVPSIFGFPKRLRLRLLIGLGGVATVAALWYTQSRGPAFAVIPAALLLAWRLSPWWRVNVLVAMVAFVLVMLLASPFWGCVAVLVALAGLAGVRRWRVLLPLTLALGLAGGLQVLDAYMLHYDLASRVSERALEDGARSILYREAVQALPASPWWGIGDTEAAVRVTHSACRPLQNLPRTQQNYHNQYLHWAVAEGWPAALALILLVCGATYWCWRQSSRWTDPFARGVGLSVAAALTIFLLCNLVDAHFWRIEGGGFFWSLLAVAAGIGASSSTIPAER